MRAPRVLSRTDRSGVVEGRTDEAANAGTTAFIIDYYLAQGEIGLDLVTAIRSGDTAAPKETPVIVTSGDERRREAALEAGANTFLLKPYGPSVLTGEISSLTGEESSG